MRRGRISYRKYSGENGLLLFGRAVDIDTDPAAGWTPARLRALQVRAKKELGWSLPRLAREIGMSETHYKNLKLGHRDLNPRIALALDEVEGKIAVTVAEQDELLARTGHYLTVALVRHKDHLSEQDKRVLKRIFG